MLLREVADTYHATLKQSPEAQTYLVQRGLVHGELIDTFRLGYANKSLTYRLPPGYAKEGRDVRAKLQRVGVYRESGHEHLNGCLVVPVIDLETGDVRQMYGRRIAPGHKIPAAQPKHLYLSLPLAGVWNEAALVASREVIVCEALIDALTFWCAGYRNVIAAYGVNGFTADHWSALKLLQSDGELTIASTGKDEATGNLVTKQYRVKGPVMLMLTTTAIDVDEELLNRCLVLTINESREQTREIHARQRSKQTLEGLLAETDKQHVIELHRNAQRLLKPVHVVNPFAEQLTFMDDKTRTRRDHMKYLTLIRSIALLHQYQRPHRSVTNRGDS